MKKSIFIGILVALVSLSCVDDSKKKEEEQKKLELQKEIKAIDSTVVELEKINEDILKSTEELDELLKDL
ncbi:MAG: hypothetical protein KUG68_06580 [Flavobacteriaceae bacterium]|nr:hypothetical protein [Flavobacteriaceae bacterium]